MHYMLVQNIELPNFITGARKGDSFEYKDVVTFTCDYGYYMSGDSDRYIPPHLPHAYPTFSL